MQALLVTVDLINRFDLKTLCRPGDIDSAHYDCSIWDVDRRTPCWPIASCSCDGQRHANTIVTRITSITSTGTRIIITTTTAGSNVCFSQDIGCCRDLIVCLLLSRLSGLVFAKGHKGEVEGSLLEWDVHK